MSDELPGIKYARAATISAIIVCAVGSLGNFITLLALIRCPKLMAQAATAFVLSLCISDFLFCSVSLPIITFRYLYEKFILGTLCCKLFPVLFYGNVAVSLLNMVAITINRYAFIACLPYYNKLYCNVSIFLQLVLIWSTSFLIALPPLMEIWDKIGYRHSAFSCTILKGLDEESLRNSIFLVGFVFPCIVIVFFYICMYLKVRNSSRNMLRHYFRVNGWRSKSTRKEQEDSRLTELLVLIFICFISCFLPLMAVNFFDNEVQFPTLHVLSSILAWASSVINPFIYAAINRQYRSAYANLFYVFRRASPPRIRNSYPTPMPRVPITNTIINQNRPHSRF